MTKLELSRIIAKETGIDVPTVQAVIEGMMSVVKNTVATRQSVFLRGFGTFGLKHRATKVARNITRNTSVIVPEHDIPTFKPCREFLEAVK